MSDMTFRDDIIVTAVTILMVMGVMLTNPWFIAAAIVSCFLV